MFRILILPERRMLAGAAVLLPLLLAACEGGKQPDAVTVQQPGAAETPVRLAGGLPASTTPVPPPAPKVVTYESAEAAYRDGSFRDAKEMFETYVGTRPDNPWGHYMLGLSAWKSGDFKRAEGAFDRALELDPKHVKSLLNSARVLMDQGRDHEAVERVNKALALDSNSSEGFRLLARVHDKLGDKDAAKEIYRKALVQSEEDVWALNNLAMLYFDEGDAKGALAPLARAVQLKPTSPIFQNNLGMVLEHNGFFESARLAYEAAVKSDSGYGKAVRNAERFSVMTVDPGTRADLPGLAELFRQTIKGWKEAGAR